MDPELELFRRQYLQLFDVDLLAWPPKALLKDTGVQSWLYNNLFTAKNSSRLPPARYQLRVLKTLVKKIEQSIDDPEQDELSDDLFNHLSILIANPLPPESTAVQQKTNVTFTCLTHNSQGPAAPTPSSPDPIVTLLERRNLISGSQTTGYRTWEAALHLGTYLLNPANRAKIHDKNILELGAGTGFLSILCAKHLRARHVTTTDGDEGVVEALKENFFVNGLDDEEKCLASVLRWGHGLKGSWVEEDCEERPYDLIIGADIVSHLKPRRSSPETPKAWETLKGKEIS